jgi:L-iditol 2-dehydrogenase
VKACVLHAVSDLRVEQVEAPAPKAGEALVRVGACGVCGSDIPRVFNKGTYRFPTIIGHEFAGVVEGVGPDTDASVVGRNVAVFPLLPCRTCAFCRVGEYALCRDYDYLGSRSDGAFADYVCAPLWNLLPVPAGVNMEEAAMTEPAAVAAHALRQGGIDVGDTVAIFGAGPIGLMLAQWARVWGASRVLLVDVDADRLAFARDLGFSDTCNAADADPAEWVADMTTMGADLVVEGSGASPAFEQCMRSARPFGRVVLMGNPAGEMRLSQDGYWAILRKQLHVSGTWNSTYSGPGEPGQEGRYGLPRNEWLMALDYMGAGRLDVKPLITHRVGLDEVPEALAMMRDRAAFANKVMYVA